MNTAKIDSIAVVSLSIASFGVHTLYLPEECACVTQGKKKTKRRRVTGGKVDGTVNTLQFSVKIESTTATTIRPARLTVIRPSKSSNF